MDKHKFCILAFYHLCLLAGCSSQRYRGDRCIDSMRRSGVCIPITQCPAVQEELRRGVRPFTCGFSGNVAVVCCSNRAVTNPGTTAPTKPPRKPGEAAAKWCKEYTKHCPEVYAIAGGEPALPGEFPHMAAVGYGSQNDIQWQCGGSLISDKFVLTAAHCLHSGRRGPAQWVLLGTEILAPNSDSLKNKGQIHPVVRRIRHPGYKPPAKYNDVALLELGPAISRNALSTTSKKLYPGCLQINDNYRYSSYVATGWGRVGHGEDPSLDLLKVRLNLHNEAKCNETFDVEIRTTNQLRRGIDSTMLCAGILKGGKDTCQGDSGGPLQSASITGCKFEIWGITSFGKICSFANSPSVYSKVSAYVEWIEGHVWP